AVEGYGYPPERNRVPPFRANPSRLDYSIHVTDGNKLHTEAAPTPGGVSPEAQPAQTMPNVPVPSRLNGEVQPQKTKDNAPAPLNKWQSFWAGVLHIDTTKIEPWIAARNALGVAAPLIVGLVIHMPQGGLAVASGALNVSYSDSHDPY